MSRSKESKTDKLLEKSAKGVTFLLFGQVFTKFSTFIMNQILISYISAKIFGINAFLEFLTNTILFFSREGIRLSSQRIQGDPHDDDEDIDEKALENKYDHNRLIKGTNLASLQTIINVAYVPLSIGIPLSTIVMYWQYGKISDTFKHMQLFNTSLIVLWFAIIIELLSEPFYIMNQYNINYEKRTQFETLGITLSCFVNFGIVFYFRNQVELGGLPILSFAIGKLVHSSVLLISYYIHFRHFKKHLKDGNKLSLKLSKIYRFQNDQDKNYSSIYYYFDSDIMDHFYRMFFNLCFKHLLTEGDKLVINSLCTIEEQGIYSLISNYGSLLARLIFAPVEESLRNFLTRLLIDEKILHKNLKIATNILKQIFTFYIYLSLIIIIFGPLNSGFLIQKLIGNNWSNIVSKTIPIYTLYLPLLAFNGILEAIHQSTATGNEVVKYTYYMVFFSAIFMGTSYITISSLELSINGLIYANMVNMALRIFYCYKFISKVFQTNHVQFDLQTIVDFTNPKLKSILTLSIGIWGLDILIFGVVRNYTELIGNILLALILVAFLLFNERELILTVIKRKPLV